jgi:hypothetical protein
MPWDDLGRLHFGHYSLDDPTRAALDFLAAVFNLVGKEPLPICS